MALRLLGQRPDHDPVGGVEVVEDGSCGVPQPTGHPMTLNGVAHCFRDDQADPRSGFPGLVGARVQHQVGLGGLDSLDSPWHRTR